MQLLETNNGTGCHLCFHCFTTLSCLGNCVIPRMWLQISLLIHILLVSFTISRMNCESSSTAQIKLCFYMQTSQKSLALNISTSSLSIGILPMVFLKKSSSIVMPLTTLSVGSRSNSLPNLKNNIRVESVKTSCTKISIKNINLWNKCLKHLMVGEIRYLRTKLCKCVPCLKLCFKFLDSKHITNKF